MLDRPLEELATKGRPLTAKHGIEELAQQRMPIYRAWADLTVSSTDCAANTAAALMSALPRML